MMEEKKVYNDTLLGRDKEQLFLRSLCDKNCLGQTWIFSGDKGIGKASLAFQLIRFIYSEDSNRFSLGRGLKVSDEDPVNRQIEQGTLRDFLLLAPDYDDKKKKVKSVISVDKARKVSTFYTMHAARKKAQKRICLIDDAEFLNKEAANALLKIIEDPPSDALIIFISHNTALLPITIRSRCQVLRCLPLPEVELETILKQKFPNEDIESLAPFIEKAKGIPAKAIMHYEQKELFYEIMHIINALPTIDLDRTQNIIKKIADTDARAIENFEYIGNVLADWLYEYVIQTIAQISCLENKFVHIDQAITLRANIIMQIKKAIQIHQNRSLVFFDFMHQIRNIAICK